MYIVYYVYCIILHILYIPTHLYQDQDTNQPAIDYYTLHNMYMCMCGTCMCNVYTRSTYLHPMKTECMHLRCSGVFLGVWGIQYAAFLFLYLERAISVHDATPRVTKRKTTIPRVLVLSFWVLSRVVSRREQI